MSSANLIDNLNSHKETAQKVVPDDYDPFGVHGAVQRAVEGQPWWHSVGAKLLDWSVFLVALLPLPLLLASSFLVFISGVPVMKWIAGAFLLWAGLFLIHQFRLLSRGERVSMKPTSQDPGRRGAVIVIGAGPSGLAVVKECLAQGLHVQCFERQEGVGGV